MTMTFMAFFSFVGWLVRPDQAGSICVSPS
jgi:hypothetical protein